MDQSNHVRHLVEALRPRLIDLSGRNRLISFRHSDSSRRELRIAAPSLDGTWSLLYGEGRSIKVASLPHQPTGSKVSPLEWAAANGIRLGWDEAPPQKGDGALQTAALPVEFERRASHIYSTAKLSLSERGVTALFGVFGFLEWYENEAAQAPTISPLLTMPLRLERVRQGMEWRYSVAWTGEDPAPNIALLERLREDLALPAFTTLDSPGAWLDAVAANLPTRERPWRIHRWLTLGLLDFTRLPMWADLDPARWTDGLPVTGLVADVLGGLAHDPPPDLSIDDVDSIAMRELVPYTLLDADASQFRVIAEAMRGRSLVIQGPPGTGKSQTIANLIALALDRGKTVLFVSEKQAALDVVLKRLEEVGLDSFCLALHSARADKKQVTARLSERLHARAQSSPPPPLDDDANLERDRKILNDFPAKMHRSATAAGGTLHQLIGRLVAARKASSPLPFAARSVSLHDVRDWTSGHLELGRDALAALEAAWHDGIGQYGRIEKHPWFALAAEDLTPVAQESLIAAVQAVQDAAAEVACAQLTANAACAPLAALSSESRAEVAERVVAKPLPAMVAPDPWLLGVASWTGRQDLVALAQRLREAAGAFEPIRDCLAAGAPVPDSDVLDTLAIEIERLGLPSSTIADLGHTGAEWQDLARRWDLILGGGRLPAPNQSPRVASSELIDAAAAATHAATLEGARWWHRLTPRWWQAQRFVRHETDHVGERVRERSQAARTLRDRLSLLGFRPEVVLADVVDAAQHAGRGYGTLREVSALHPSFIASADAATCLIALRQADSALSVGAWIDAVDVPDAVRNWLLSESPGVRIQALRDSLAAERATQMALRERERVLHPMLAGTVADELGRRDPAMLAWRLGNATAASDSLPQYVRYLRLLAEAETLRVRPVINAFEEVGAVPRQLPAVLELVYLERAVSEAVHEDVALRRFHGREHELIRSRFASNDRSWRLRAARHVAGRVAQRIVPAGRRDGGAANLTDAALIRHVGAQTRPKIAVRELFRRSAGAIQALCPCLMLSPLTVSQFIEPGAMTFDLVVMDEASQLRPEDALGALMRARQAVIVGDNKQMPPSNFFVTAFGNNADGAATAADDIGESILDVAKTRLHPYTGNGGEPPMLLWHYRSRHPSLIAFSNRTFYDDRLQLFPQDAGGEGDLGLSLERVEGGVYGSSENPVEALAVATAAADEMRRHPDRSLLIVALNIQQKELIESQINLIANEHSDIREYMEDWQSGLSPFFVKNLDNVQGDERDTILISTIFGCDAKGTFAQNFGEVSKPAGPRRLNVLFSRAVRRMRVFTSMDPSWISAPSEGARVLKGFLEYAATGRLRDEHAAGNATNYGPDSPFEQAVLDALRAKGYTLVPQVGVGRYRIDLAVCHPGEDNRFVLGIECDGATYHSSRSARDRDRLRQQVLEQLGWTIARVWSLDWWREPDVEVARLVGLIEDALAGRAPKPTRAPFVNPVETPPNSSWSTQAAPVEPTDMPTGQPAGAPRRTPSVPASAPSVAAKPSAAGVQVPLPFGGANQATAARDQDLDAARRRGPSGPTPTRSAPTAPRDIEALRTRLVGLREEIMTKDPDVPRAAGVLRKTMLEAFLRTCPTTMEEFRARIPLSLRQDTDHRHAHYVAEIVRVIAEWE